MGDLSFLCIQGYTFLCCSPQINHGETTLYLCGVLLIIWNVLSFLLSEDWYTFWSYHWSLSRIRSALSLQNFPYFIACLLLPTQLHLHLFLSNFTLCEVNDFDPDTLVLCSCCIPRYGVTIANMYLIIQLGYFTKYCWDNISILNKELMWTNTHWNISYSPSHFGV